MEKNSGCSEPSAGAEHQPFCLWRRRGRTLPSSESEEAPYSEETSDTASAAELSDEQREVLDDWIWYERGDYTSENWYHIASDGTVEMHTEYGSTEDTYTAYPMLGCSYNFEAF